MRGTIKLGVITSLDVIRYPYDNIMSLLSRDSLPKVRLGLVLALSRTFNTDLRSLFVKPC